MKPERALAAWGRDEPLRPAPDAGLINRTWLVGDPPDSVLQWVNPIFDPLIHRDIAAVTECLGTAGVPAPRLLPTAGGELWLADDEGCWRLMSHLPGRTLHRLENPAQAAEAGTLVGRFHAPSPTGATTSRPRAVSATTPRPAWPSSTPPSRVLRNSWGLLLKATLLHRARRARRTPAADRRAQHPGATLR